MAKIFDADSLAYYAAAGAENRVWEAIGLDSNDDPVAHQRFQYKADADKWASQFHDAEFERVAEPGPPHHAYHTIKMWMLKLQDLLSDFTEDGQHVLLTGEGNFRIDLATIRGYKANRKYPKPVLLQECRNYLEENWDGVVVDGREADDECSIIAYRNRKAGKTKDVIVSIDKDLNMIPGLHYNWQRETFYEVDELTGIRFFYKQLLMGDAGDNIPGCAGIGTSNPLLDEVDELHNEWDMFVHALNAYEASYTSRWCTYQDMDPMDVLLENARLLWMQQWPDQLWVPPTMDGSPREWERLGEF